MLLLLFSGIICCRFTFGEEDFQTFPTNMEEYMQGFKTFRPLIAVTTMHTGNKSLVKKFHKEDTYYIGASYIKFIEMAGGRVVPIFNRQTDRELYTILESVNGALIGGGDADVGDSGYKKVVDKVLRYAMKKKSTGIHWPVIGMCRGAQILAISISSELELIKTDSKNYSVPLEFEPGFEKSRLFRKAPKSLIKRLKKYPLTMNAHVHGIDPNNLRVNEKLNKFYRIISTNTDRQGVKFISTFEAFDYPFYGFQWHPEKVLFVHNPNLATDHSLYGIQVSQYIANFFVSEAKLNGQHFHSLKGEQRHLVYNWNPVYVGNVKLDTPYEQIYLFSISGIAREHPRAQKISSHDKKIIKAISESIY